MTDTEVDKKRSKLGYQRIQVACVHCRRRKIRCVIDENDPERRCHNCIRLKKDCHFMDVDQQELAKKPHRSSGAVKAGSASSSVLPPSSPDLGGGRSIDEQDEYGVFPTGSPAMSTGYHGLPVEPGSVLHNEVPFTNVDYGYQPMTETRQSWSHDRYGSHVASVGTTISSQAGQQYWRHNQPGSSGDYAPFPTDPMQPPQTSQSAHAYAYRNQRVDQAWQQPQHPVRSISHDHLEGGVPYSASPYAVGYYEDTRHGRGQPSLAGQGASMAGHGPGSRSVPMRQPHYVNQPHPYQVENLRYGSAHTGSQNPYPGDWNSNHPQYEQMEDDED